MLLQPSLDLVDFTFHVEGLLTFVVVFAVQNFPKTSNSVFQGYVSARNAAEDFGHMERLGEEALDAARPRYSLLICIAEFFHTQNGDDILQVFVALQYPLDLASHLV